MLPARIIPRNWALWRRYRDLPEKQKKYDGPEFPAEMLIFSEMNSDQVDAFLAEYKKAGVEPIALKAVITGNNIFWTAERTQKELLREHLFMSNIYKSNM